MEPRSSCRSLVAGEVKHHGDISIPDLAQKKPINDLGRFYQFDEHGSLACRKLRDVGREIGWGEARRHFIELVSIRRSGGKKRWQSQSEGNKAVKEKRSSHGRFRLKRNGKISREKAGQHSKRATSSR